MPNQRFNEEEAQEIRLLYEQQFSLRALSIKYQCGSSAISTAIYRAGGQIRSKRAALQGHNRGKTYPPHQNKLFAALAHVNVSHEKLREARLTLKLTQQQVSDRIGCKLDMMREWETGRKTPSGPYLLRLLLLYQIPARSLAALKRTPESEKPIHERQARHAQILLLYQQGLKVVEIARQLGISKQAVSAHIKSEETKCPVSPTST